MAGLRGKGQVLGRRNPDWNSAIARICAWLAPAAPCAHSRPKYLEIHPEWTIWLEIQAERQGERGETGAQFIIRLGPRCAQGLGAVKGGQDSAHSKKDRLRQERCAGKPLRIRAKETKAECLLLLVR